MTDDIKELLTLAAKACGYEVPEDGPFGGVDEKWGVYVFNEDGSRFLFKWAPHLDDGDGARMEELLSIVIDYQTEDVLAYRWTDDISECEPIKKHQSRQAARRWASLRAAAQIGRSMP